MVQQPIILHQIFISQTVINSQYVQVPNVRGGAFLPGSYNARQSNVPAQSNSTNLRIPPPPIIRRPVSHTVTSAMLRSTGSPLATSSPARSENLAPQHSSTEVGSGRGLRGSNNLPRSRSPSPPSRRNGNDRILQNFRNVQLIFQI